ncbi:MAG: class I SAM-dependent methyltransferase [Arenicella sp.]|nr:class I SAM-dependent methyltransferase [Arenicella sp.]
MTFEDHFSGHSEQYSAFRPIYPAQLFSHLASRCASLDRAWDCATGSGQSARGLASYFAEVIATDASANQIASAIPVAGVRYAVASAEDSGIESNSVDLITVAQALHWFDLEAFTREANRVLKDQGVLAVWTYWLVSINSEIDAIIAHFHNRIVGDYWAFDRSLVESGYARIVMPFDELQLEPIEMTAQWSFNDLIGYLDTWSAARSYQKMNKRNPLELVENELAEAWGQPDSMRVVSWPLLARVWRKAT